MARKVFFSFHFEKDIWRVIQIRDKGAFSSVTAKGYADVTGYESIKEEDDSTIKSWIDSNLKYTEITVVLVGTETFNRHWVKYELQESYKMGNGILAIHINNVKDRMGQTCKKGDCSFVEIAKDNFGNPIYFHELYYEYDWVNDGGYKNFGMWVEKAARDVGID